MESSLGYAGISAQSSNTSVNSLFLSNGIDATSSSDALVLETTLNTTTHQQDQVSLDFQELYKSLSVGAKQMIDKLNQLLKQQLPDGIQSLKPEEVTPEATADRIVQGATGFYEIYARQHPELEGEELLNSFLNTIKQGIQQGYDEAAQTLDGLGAFQFEGIKEGIEETKSLIDSKLKTFEQLKRKELGLDDSLESQVGARTNSALLSQATAGILSIQA